MAGVDIAPGIPSYNPDSNTNGVGTLDLNPPEQGTLDLLPEKRSVTYNNEYSQTKANRFAVALGPMSPGTDVINNAIATGDQTRWQYLLKQNEDVNNAIARNQVISQIAQQAGGNPSIDDIDIVSHLSNDDLHSSDLNTILEKKYSDYFTNTVSSVSDNVVFPKAADESENATADVLNLATIPQQRNLIAQDKLEEINKRYDESSWFGAKGWSFAAGMIPGWAWYQNHNRIDIPNGALAQGRNLAEQIGYLYTLPPDQFKTTLDQAVDSLANVDIGQAQSFIQAVSSYSTTDAAYRNLFDLADVTSMGVYKDIGVGGFKGVRALARGMSTAGKAVTINPEELSKAAAQAGMNKASAISSLTKDALAGDPSGAKVISNAADLEERLPSALSPQKAFTDTTPGASAANNRLRLSVQEGQELAQKFLTSNEGVDVLEPQQIAQAARDAFDTIKDHFGNVQHNIIDIQNERIGPSLPYTITPAEENKIINRPVLNVRFGEKDGTYFSTPERAENFAKKYIGIKTGDYSVEQNGVGGYYVNVKRTLGAGGDFRNVEIDTDLKAPESLASNILRLGKYNLRSPDYLVSQANVEARGRALHNTEYLGDLYKEMTKPFQGLKKTERDELGKVFKSNRTNEKYYANEDEFQREFRAINGKAPTDSQTDAYFRYVQLNDLDYMVRDADYVKQMIDKGGERFSIKIPNEKGEPIVKQFNGVERKSLPYDSKDHYSVTVVNNGKVGLSKNSRFFNQKDRELFEELMSNQGFKLLSEEGSSNYYLIKDFKRDQIKLGSLNYRAGGHNEYAYDYFIKQGRFSTDSKGVKYYGGDRSLFSAVTQQQAKEIAELFEKARQMYKANDPRAPAFIEDNLPISWAEWNKKVKSGQVDPDAPIMSVRRGERTDSLRDYSKDFEHYDNSISSEHNPFAGVGGRYIGERADQPIDVLKSENGVVFKHNVESLLDPWETLRTSSANMLDLKATQDYITKSQYDWVQQFGHLLDVDQNKLKANPLHYLVNGTYKQGVDSGQAATAENVRRAILGFINYDTPEMSSIKVFQEKLLNSVYNYLGEDAHKFVDQNLLDKDPVSFMRKTAFNLKLGLFNVKQLFLQAAQGANIVSILPKEGTSSGRIFLPTMMALRTEEPAVLGGLYNKFGKLMGWEKQDWLDMVDSFKASGFSHVGNDYAYGADLRPKPSIVNGKLKQVLSHHTDFFTAGEQAARTLAYGAAWREFKNNNPGKVIDRFARTKILQRAKDLTGNMTRDSNAAWQKGLAGLATQFMSYQARFMEALWDGGGFWKNGRKLTVQEKSRLLVGMSLLYGTPIIGSSLTGYDWRGQIKQWMADEGIPFDNEAMSVFVDGVAPSLLNFMTGMDEDFSSAYGPNGVASLSDMFNGEKSMAELMGGASVGIIADLWKSAGPAAQGVVDMFNPNSDSTWPVTIQELLEPLKVASSVQNATKLYEAINTHRWLSKNGTYLTDVTTPEAIIAAVTGVNPDRVSNAYSKIAAIKKSNKAVSEYQKEVSKWFSLGIDAARKGDEDSAEVYFSRSHAAGIRGGLSLSEINQARRGVLSGNPLDENVERTYEQRVIRHNNTRKALQRLNSVQQNGD